VLAEHATGRQRTHIAARVDALIADLIDRESIIDTLVEELRRGAGRGSTTDVDAAYEDDRATRWTNAVQARIEADFEPDEDAITGAWHGEHYDTDVLDSALFRMPSGRIHRRT
jgi:hypothetical protein